MTLTFKLVPGCFKKNQHAKYLHVSQKKAATLTMAIANKCSCMYGNCCLIFTITEIKY